MKIKHKIIDAVEIDKFAVRSFNAIHGTNFEPQDIMKWDKNIKIDLIMHGSPCQDFSIAGLQAGGDKGSGTRSSLMYETLRIVEKLRPKYVIWENVKNILSKKHRHNYSDYIKAMTELGYKSFSRVLNARDFNVPQNRERVFTISILRTSTNPEPEFVFPEPQPLEKRLKDILEEQVDEKYYLTADQARRLLASKYDSNKRIYKSSGISPTLNSMSGGWREPKIIDDTYRNREPREYNRVSPTLRSSRSGLKVEEPFVVASRGRGEKGDTLQHAEPRTDGVTNTITTVQKDNYIFSSAKIRKLTPMECWRLMGFYDEDFKKAKASGVSDHQLYRQAGNSIVVDILQAILKNLLA